MKNILLLLTFLPVFNNITAQNDDQRPENEFAFAIRNTDANNTALRIPGDTVKYQRAKRIFEKLVAARGDSRYAVPDFVMTKNVQKVAWMNYDRLEVGIEEKAFDVCMTFGKDADAALASLLGHELSHYYEKHSWRRDFARQYSDLAVGKQLGVMNQADSLFNETQADYIGGFLAFSAGFPVFDKAAEMTGALYKAYNFPDKLRIYPSLAERKLLNVRSSQLLDKLVNVYETANLLTIVGNHANAVMYYQYVLQEYQSSALYNNAGVLTILAGLDLSKDSAYNYVLPIELDMNSINSRGTADFEARDKLLREALRHFDAAINLDPDYAPAYLNKACALVILSDIKRARYYVEVELAAAVQRKPAYKKTDVDGKVVLGILAMLEGDSTKADQIFQNLFQNEASAVAQENLVRLRTKKPSPFVPRPLALSFIAETIDDINLSLEAEELEVDIANRINVGPGMTFFQNVKLKDGAHSKLLQAEHVIEGKKRKTYFLVTTPEYKGETANSIKIGSPAKDVLDAYGNPKKTIESTGGQLWLYDSIIFNIGEKGVTGWVLWLEG